MAKPAADARKRCPAYNAIRSSIRACAVVTYKIHLGVIEIRRYVTRAGKDLIGDWLAGLDAHVRARIAVRIDRLSLGNFGDCKSLREGVSELRIDWGPGYRVYYALLGRTCVLLLCGGDKRRQASDINRAIECLHDYKERTRKP